MNHEALVQARRAAEAAVADMEDGPLKTTAFQTILAQLLRRESGDGGTEPTRTFSNRGSVRKKGSAPGGTGTTSRLLSLIEDGIFEQQRSLAEIRRILSERGWHYQLVDLGTPVTRLVRRKQLRRTRVTEGGKKVWKYSNY